MSNSFSRVLAVLLALAVLPLAGPAQAQNTVTVFAASSLTDALKQVAAAFKASGAGGEVVLSFGASNTLAQQIDQGAKADIYMSADTDWMDFLDKKDALDRSTRRNLLVNQLVLIGGRGSKPITIAPGFNLKAALGNRRLALADPNSVPAGKYAKASLSALGVWDSVAGQIAPAENVRVALAYVSSGESPYGIVYETDAKVDANVHVVGTFPANTHPAIVYPVAALRNPTPSARAFLAFLGGAQAKAIFTKAGFTALPPAQ